MTHAAVRRALPGALILAALLAPAPRAESAQRSQPSARPAPADRAAPATRAASANRSAGVPPAGEAAPGAMEPSGNDPFAERTREELDRLFEKYPPAVARVLRLDPALMNNGSYLAPYPELGAFIAAHPGITRNPDYFLEHVREQSSDDPRRRQRQDMLGVLAGLAVFLAFLVIMSIVVWLIRLIVTHRRWNRLSKVQYETHSRLLERFTSNDELLAYIQTPAGRRFLEAAPIQMQDAQPSIAAPLARILWSVQAGVILAILGGGLFQVSRRFTDEPAQVFTVAGILLLALGVGFVVSAAAAYLLSRRLGLLERPAVDHA